MLSVMHADGDPDSHRAARPSGLPLPGLKAAGWGQTDKSAPWLPRRPAHGHQYPLPGGENLKKHFSCFGIILHSSSN